MSLLEGSIRKCLVKKWTDGESSGYGFNLHAEMGKPGHYIGKVDDGSPAEVAGLREGDRIVEVNNVNIGNENHKQVVSRIKAGGDSVWLLVVDKRGDEYSTNNRVELTQDLPQTKVVECPDARPGASDKGEDSAASSVADLESAEHDYETPPELPAPDVEHHDSESNRSEDESDEDLPPPPPELSELDAAVNSASAGDEPPKHVEPSPPSPEAEANTTAEELVEPSTPPKYEEEEEEEEVRVDDPKPEEPKPEEPKPEEPKPEVPKPEEPKPEVPKPEVPSKPAESQPLNGTDDTAKPVTPKTEAVPKMTAAEMREALARNRRSDPRKEKSLTAKDKLKMFQNL